MPNFKCKIEIEDDIDADNEEEAKDAFLQMVEEMGVKAFCCAADVEVEENEEEEVNHDADKS